MKYPIYPPDIKGIAPFRVPSTKIMVDPSDPGRIGAKSYNAFKPILSVKYFVHSPEIPLLKYSMSFVNKDKTFYLPPLFHKAQETQVLNESMTLIQKHKTFYTPPLFSKFQESNNSKITLDVRDTEGITFLSSLTRDLESSSTSICDVYTSLDGSTISAFFDDSMAVAPASPAGFIVAVNGNNAAVTAVVQNVNNNHEYDLTLDTPVEQGQTVTLSYSSAAGVQSLGGVALVSFTNVEAVNNVPYAGGIDQYTTLLLHCNGPNGCVIFSDSSQSQHIITASNGAQTSTTEAEFGTSSAFFNGSNSYLSTPSSDDFVFDTLDFTLDACVYLNAMPAEDSWPGSWSSCMQVLGVGTPGLGDGCEIVLGATQIILQSNDNEIIHGPHGISTGAWHHVAVTNNEGTFRLFVDGVIVATATFSGSMGTGSNFYLGSETGQGAWLNGYITEARVSRGIARWTANFTPPTEPYYSSSPPVVSNVSTSTDGSTIAVVFSKPMDTVPMAPAGFTATVAGSAVSIASIAFDSNNNSNNEYVLTLATPVDGYNQTVTLSYDSTAGVQSQDGVALASFSNLTVTNGMPYVSPVDEYTTLMLHCDGLNGGTTFYDSSPSPNVVTVNGSVCTDTSTKEFGTASASFIGGYGNLSIPGNAGFDFGVGDFTIECWLNTENAVSNNTIFAYGGDGSGSGVYAFRSAWNGNVPSFGFDPGSSGPGIILSVPIAINSWHHFAVARNSDILYMFVDGIIVSTLNIGTYSVPIPGNYTFYVGSNGGYTGGWFWDGHVDEFRVSKGIARWTTNFTPPLAPYLSLSTVNTNQIPMTIDNTSGPALSAYQNMISIDTTDLINTGKMRSDCGDIYVVDSDGATPLPFWINPITVNTPTTMLYVKRDMAAGEVATIYVQHGDLNATTTASGANTFEFFDDFSEGLSQWTAVGNVSVSGDGVEVGPGPIGHNCDLTSLVSVQTANTITEVDVRPVSTSDGWQGRINLQYVSLLDVGIGSPGDSNLYLSKLTSNANQYYQIPVVGEWRTLRLTNSPTEAIAEDVTKGVSCSLTQNDGSVTAAPINLYSGYGNGNDFRNIRVSKYTATTPNISVGADELIS